MYPTILDNPYFCNRVRDLLVTNHPVKYNGVGVRVFNKNENSVLIYKLANREFATLEDYLKLEWFDTNDEGRTFMPCSRETMKEFMEAIARG